MLYFPVNIILSFVKVTQLSQSIYFTVIETDLNCKLNSSYKGLPLCFLLYCCFIFLFSTKDYGKDSQYDLWHMISAANNEGVPRTKIILLAPPKNLSFFHFK